MTVPRTYTPNVATANGVTTTFSFGFLVLEAEHLVVELDGVALPYPGGYTVTGVGDNAGGDALLAVAPTTGVQVVCRRVTTVERETDYQNLGDLLADTLNADQDTPILILQEVKDEQSRAIRIPFPENANTLLPPMQAGKYLRAKLDNSGFEYIEGTGSVPGDFIQSGTGAVPRSYDAKLGEVVSVKDFGAVGNGATDDTAAFQLAANLGRAIFVPPGNYIISSTVNVAVANTTFYGNLEGSASEATITYTGTANAFNVTGSFNCTFWGLKFAHTGASGRILSFASGEFHEARFCQFNTYNASIASPMIYFRSSFTTIDGCGFSGDSGAQFAIECDRTAGLININSSIVDCGFGGVIKGILCRASDGSARPEGLEVSRCRFISTGEVQLEIREVLSARIFGNMFDQGNNACVRFAPSAQNVEGVILANNYIATAQNPTGVSGGVAVGITAASVGNLVDCIVIGNTIEFSAYGVSFNSRCSGIQIIGNKFSVIDQDCIGAGQSINVTISNNITRNCAGRSLAISDGASGGPFIITGNHLNTTLGSVVTITNASKFEFGHNFGRRFSGWASQTTADPGSSTFINLAHGLVLPPNIGKIVVGLAETTGAHTNMAHRIISVTPTDIVMEIFYTTVVAGDIRVNVFCSA